MASGRKPFAGKTQASLIGAIMHSEPELVSTIAPMAPPAFDRVVQQCLAKDPEERWHTAHDLKLQLQWIAEGGSQVGVPAPVAARRKSRERLAWAVAAGLALVAAAFAFGFLQRAPEPREVVRFEIPQPEGLPVVDSPKVSPDGRYIAYNATDEQGKTMIWLRPLNALEAQPMPGTDDAMRPFWSPDSKFLGFMAKGKLKKIPVSGGPAQVICDAPTGADGTWSEEGIIFYDGTGGDPIMKVAASGGIPTELVSSENPDSANLEVGWPQFLPGGEKFLYVNYQGEDGAEIRVADVDGGNEKTVLKGQSRVEYAPPGYLLYVREETLVAQPFDANAGELTGEPVPLAEDLSIDNVGLAHFSASRNGVLALRGGDAGGGQLMWTDRSGESREMVGDPGDIGAISLSPDGRWLAMVVTSTSAEAADIWVRDLSRGVTSRFTFNEEGDYNPTWSPDGRRIVFSATRDGNADLAVRAVGGSGEVEFLLESERAQHPSSWSSDGRYLLYYDRGEETNWDIWVLPLAGDEEPYPFLMTPFVEVRSRFSPDDRWVAYQSNESGRSEIYVQEFPGPGGKWQISTAGGSEPQWSPDGKELYYISPEMNMMRVSVQTGDSFDAGIPEAMFPVRLRQIINTNRYLVAPGGERFLLLSSLQEDSTPPTTIVLNWDAALGQ
jgi:Tol biopolymer transport system component